MLPLFQLSTRSYDEEITLVKNAMAELEKKCNVSDGYTISEPNSKLGWTTFNLQLSLELEKIIEESGMMEGALGHKIGEQLKNFLGHYFESKGSQVRIKKIPY